MDYKVIRAHIGYPTGSVRTVRNQAEASRLQALGLIAPMSPKAAPAPSNKAAPKRRNKAAPKGEDK